jgi:hypothetical protein
MLQNRNVHTNRTNIIKILENRIKNWSTKL